MQSRQQITNVPDSMKIIINENEDSLSSECKNMWWALNPFGKRRIG